MPTRTQETGNRTCRAKRTGLLSVTKGEAYSHNASYEVSFGYFRTQSGRPPDVEARETEAGRSPEDKLQNR